MSRTKKRAPKPLFTKAMIRKIRRRQRQVREAIIREHNKPGRVVQLGHDAPPVPLGADDPSDDEDDPLPF